MRLTSTTFFNDLGLQSECETDRILNVYDACCCSVSHLLLEVSLSLLLSCLPPLGKVHAETDAEMTRKMSFSFLNSLSEARHVFSEMVTRCRGQ